VGTAEGEGEGGGVTRRSHRKRRHERADEGGVVAGDAGAGAGAVGG